MLDATAQEAMAGLGFTGLEAQIYAFLLSESPATGYRIAQAIRKPAANTYKAIATLEAKGALSREGGHCSALPLDQVLGQIQNRIRGQIQTAERALKAVGDAPKDTRFYAITSREQAIGLAKTAMLEAERSIALLSADALDPILIEALILAAEKGVEISVVAPPSDQLPESATWIAARDLPEGSLQVAADGAQCVLFVEPVGFATRQTAAASLIARGQRAQATLAEVAGLLEDDAGRKRLMRSVANFANAAQNR
jgi:sugar-specific transcriptional regulator TrmB